MLAPRATHIAIAAALLSVLSTACGRPITPGWQGLLEGCPTADEIGRLEAGDRIAIRVYGEEEMSGVYEVSPAGEIGFPLLGAVTVDGLRCDQVSSSLADLLREGQLLRAPSITCLNEQVERTAISVNGQVQRPGAVPFRTGMMLTDAIAQSKDLTIRADPNGVVVRRQGLSVTSVVVPYEQILQGAVKDICLHPGDAIYVPEANF